MRFIKIFIAFGLFLFSISMGIYSFGNEPNKNACPVTPNVFPTRETSSNSFRFVFPDNTVIHRFSLSFENSDGETLVIKFRWVPDEADRHWGETSGSFLAKCDGNPNCYFLGRFERIPGNVHLKEFYLQIPIGIRVKEIAFSTLPSEKPMVTCPMPELEKAINQAFKAYYSSPQDETSTLPLLQLLEKTIPRYDCRRKIDYEPIPAWWMADYKTIDSWIDFVYGQVLANNKFAFKLYLEFYDTSDGYIAEGMSYRLWEILRNQPYLVLDNWNNIQEYKEGLLGARMFASPGDNVEILIGIYREIAKREPKYTSACEEIISILKKEPGYMPLS